MKKIKANKRYTSGSGHLIMHVLKAQHVGEGYIRAKLKLVNKHGDLFEEPKVYKLYLENIKHWREV